MYNILSVLIFPPESLLFLQLLLLLFVQLLIKLTKNFVGKVYLINGGEFDAIKE